MSYSLKITRTWFRDDDRSTFLVLLWLAMIFMVKVFLGQYWTKPTIMMWTKTHFHTNIPKTDPKHRKHKLKLPSNLDIRCGDFCVTNRAQEQLSIGGNFHCHMKINNCILRKSKSLFSLVSMRFNNYRLQTNCRLYSILLPSSLILTTNVFLSELDPPSYLVGYVTGDKSIKLSWEVKSSSNNTVFELRWKISDNESSMSLPGSTGTITLKNLRVYTQYLFRVRKGTVEGSWGAFTKYTSIWTPEGGKNMNGYDKKALIGLFADLLLFLQRSFGAGMNHVRFINCQRSGAGWGGYKCHSRSNTWKQVNKDRKEEHVSRQAKC